MTLVVSGDGRFIAKVPPSAPPRRRGRNHERSGDKVRKHRTRSSLLHSSFLLGQAHLAGSLVTALIKELRMQRGINIRLGQLSTGYLE